MCIFNGKIIKNTLLRKGITELYHVNSVQTSATFFSVGGLLSRGAVEGKGLKQTSQITDSDDKLFNIWNDVFFDSCDIHSRIKKPNSYGPVCFVFDVDLMDYEYLPDIKITLQNPKSWANQKSNNRYITDIEQFKKNNFGMELTLVNCMDVIPFNPYLKKVILDNPNTENNSLFIAAEKYLKEQIKDNKLYCDFEIRICDKSCKCQEVYNEYKRGAIWHKYHI